MYNKTQKVAALILAFVLGIAFNSFTNTVSKNNQSKRVTGIGGIFFKASELQLQVNRNNSAKDFYLKFGFTILYEADFEIGNGYFMNDYVMSLVLE